ncbi:MAG: hypothetical protein EP298_02780 [Gammaproteobacteria bacterium]|nr:MAG: hypothetical protein EP298_02780 [Gammaproteobacteria bacterium]UTW43389.1 hypothetical protein KFE69_04655 [bacterium SCSIO 12844]
MKIIIKIASFFCFIFSANIYAGTTFDFTIKNTSNYSVKVTQGNWQCIKMLVNFINGAILTTNDEMIFKVQDKAEGSCEGKEKHFTIYYQFLDENNEPFGDKKGIEWARYKKDGDWGFIVRGDTKGTVILDSANCNGQDCENKWASGKKGNMFIETTDGFGKYKSIGLGEIVVTDGVGKLLEITEIDLSSTDDVYIFHFSNTHGACRYVNKMMTCDHGINLIFKSESYIFFCKQVDREESACPWISISEGINSYHANINIY